MTSMELAQELVQEYVDHNGSTQKWDKDKLRLWYTKLKSTLVCDNCGFDFEGRPECCDFHHRNPSDKTHNIGLMVNQAYGKNDILKEIKKCTALCANCHRTLHYGN